MPSALNKITQPLIYEINTWPWLEAIGKNEGRAIDLGSVPDRYWDEIADLGFDAVWLMGVWQRSPAGIAIALSNDGLLASFRAALPDWQPDDVVGSPYCVRDYVVDDHFGGRTALASAREALAERGMGLILDFVPNHVAPDHPWATLKPEVFVSGTSEDLENDPASFVEIAGRVLANGRDPYFPAWPDVVQLNAFAPALRAGVIETLIEIGEQCDGVRCDMAMLVMNDVFARTWGDRVGPVPDSDYWPTVIPAVGAAHPGFLFMAEAYWDLEWALQQHGFNYCYDKRLYDRILQGSAEQVRLHLMADDEYQHGLVRFVENHDEPRAASAFGSVRSPVAAVTALTQTGARLVHNGQLEGATVHLPVFLGRYPIEPTEEALLAFYRSFLPALADPTFRHGHWQLCDRSGWPGDNRYQNLVAWCWEGDARWLIVVNLSDGTAAGQVRTPWTDLRGQQWHLTDPTHDIVLARSGDDLVDGLFVELDPWNWHMFRIGPPTG
jgi:Alpha amylase, catalytic domain